ncbi:MAG TPA: AraC family transcriptional regulator [Kofleriaceae bacterium]|nr:AraC family transcriptional regulator [Kofleriaceae bacterium]
MPRFHLTATLATRDTSAARVVCDGCDPARPCDEHTERAALWLLTAGAFELRDRTGRHVVDPTQALIMPPGHVFQIRHHAGPDTCLAFRGPIIDALAACGARTLPVAPARLAQIVAGVAERDDLALAEALSGLAPPDGPAPPDRNLAGGITHLLRTRYAEPTSLGELADATGYSMFHACRVFRATTGTTIHGFRRELRLRHALARVLDGDEPLAEIALAVGFASQSHLTNQFRARFGITPARARSPAGRRSLAAQRPPSA